MLKIKNGIIEVCGYKLTVEKNNESLPMTYAFKTQEQANTAKAKAEEYGNIATVNELNIEDELFLDGIVCNSMDQAKEWLKAGQVIEPLTLESLAEVVADIIGGALS